MSYYYFVLRLFRLYGLYLKISGNDERKFVKEKMNELATETKIKDFSNAPDDILKCIGCLLDAFKVLYSAESNVNQIKAEIQIQKCLDELKKLFGIEGTDEELFPSS